MRVFSLTALIIRTVIAIALAASFHPKLRERAHPEETEGAQDVAEEERPLIEPEAAASTAEPADNSAQGAAPVLNEVRDRAIAASNVNVSAANPTTKQQDKRDDMDEDEEGGAKRKMCAYDLFAIAQRIKRLLPYLAPVRSRLVQLLVGQSATPTTRSRLSFRQTCKLTSVLPTFRSQWPVSS